MRGLSAERVRRRRLELGISQRELARQIGAVPNVIRAIENSTNHAVLTLAHLDALATTLGVSRSWLLGDEPDPQTDDDRSAIDRFIAMIHTGGGAAVPKTVLASQLGVPLSEIDRLAAACEAILDRLGLTLTTNANGSILSLAAKAELLGEENVSAVLRSINWRADLDEQVSRVIHQALSGSIKAKDMNTSRDKRVLLGRCVNAGWIEPPLSDAEPLRLTAAVRESLLLNVNDG